MAKDRHEDSIRCTPLYQQLVGKGLDDGDLTPYSSTENIQEYFERLRSEGKLEGEVPTLVGDDLSDSDLDDLWRFFAEGDQDSDMASWWLDKAHQVAYRLLLRLTRAENPRAENPRAEDSE